MKYQFMPMFWGDFFANTLHLTAQELGAYTALIGHAWEHDGNIAVGDLQRVARVSNYNWPKVQPRLTPFFNTLSVPNFWHHERVHSELTRAAEISNKRKGAALQMHSKSRANAHANDPHTTTTSIEASSYLVAARESKKRKKEARKSSSGELASARHGGALARRSGTIASPSLEEIVQAKGWTK